MLLLLNHWCFCKRYAMPEATCRMTGTPTTLHTAAKMLVSACGWVSQHCRPVHHTHTTEVALRNKQRYLDKQLGMVPCTRHKATGTHCGNHHLGARVAPPPKTGATPAAQPTLATQRPRMRCNNLSTAQHTGHTCCVRTHTRADEHGRMAPTTPRRHAHLQNRAATSQAHVTRPRAKHDRWPSSTAEAWGIRPRRP